MYTVSAPSSLSPLRPLEVRLFGAFEVWMHGAVMPVHSQGARRVLALLLNANRPVERAWLASELWPNTPSEARALFYLRRALTELRQALGPEVAARLLSPTPATLRFDIDNGGWCDLLAFDAAAHTADAALLEQAAALYRAPLLEGWEDAWVRDAREARAEVCLNALERLASLRRTEGDLPNAGRLLHRVLRADPLRETACIALMETLTDSGDFAGVEREYRQFRRRVRDELNSELSSDTRAVYERLRATAKEATNLVPKAAVVTMPRRLPCPLTRLIGREAAIDEAVRTIRRHRLVTLIGPGGVGKTRLSIAVAERLVGAFIDGVWFADLSATRQAEQVWQTIAVALRLAPTPGLAPDEAVCRYLGEKRLLLILDNCEHLIEACADFANRVLRECPDLRIIATSRQPLRIGGERILAVSPLEVPSSDTTADDVLNPCASVRLLLDRVESVAPLFRFTVNHAVPVAQICRRLEGIPLALELVAVRFRTLTPPEIVARLEDRFGLLTGGDRTLPRHQTLRAMVDWSDALLTETQQRVFRQVSCFVGGWTGEAAEAVTGDSEVRETLAALVEQSLLMAEEVPNGQTRYRFLETIREYAAEGLKKEKEQKRYQKRHAAYYAVMARRSAPGLHGVNAAAFFAQLDREMPNLQAAMYWLQSHGKAARSLRIAAALQEFWGTHGDLRTGRAALQSILESAENKELPEGIRRSGILALGWLELRQGDYSAARRRLRNALRSARTANHSRDTIRALRGLGYVAHQSGANRRAKPLWIAALTLARSADDKPQIASLLHDLGNHAKHRPDQAEMEKAVEYYNESIVLNRALGFPRQVALSEMCKGIALVEAHRPEEALPALEACIVLAETLGDQNLLAFSLRYLGTAWYEQGNPLQSVPYLERALQLFRERGALVDVSVCHGSLAQSFRQMGDLLRAREHLLLAVSAGAFRLGDRRAHFRLAQITLMYLMAAGSAAETVALFWGVVKHLCTIAGYTMDDFMPEIAPQIPAVCAALGSEQFEAKRAFGAALSFSEVEERVTEAVFSSVSCAVEAA